MDVPDNVRKMIDQLGAVLANALASDEDTRMLTKKIQDQGFDVVLMLEVAMKLHDRNNSGRLSVDREDSHATETEAVCQWSSEDRAFLKAFRISAE